MKLIQDENAICLITSRGYEIFPGPSLLKCSRGSDDRFLVTESANDLKTNRETLSRESTGDRGRRVSHIIKNPTKGDVVPIKIKKITRGATPFATKGFPVYF